MDNFLGRADLGRLVFGLVVLVVGVWFLLRNTFGVNLPELDGDMIWPILVVGLGLAILFNTGRRREPRA